MVTAVGPCQFQLGQRALLIDVEYAALRTVHRTALGFLVVALSMAGYPPHHRVPTWSIQFTDSAASCDSDKQEHQGSILEYAVLPRGDGNAKVRAMTRIDGRTLRDWRRSRGWDVPELAYQLRDAAGGRVAAHDGLIRMIYAWERGDHEISERYELLFRSLGFDSGQAARTDDPTPGEALPAMRGTVPRSRLEALSAGQLEELIGLLDDQWHALVRTDNLLGPRHALGGVHDQLGVIDALLRSVRPPIRHRVLQLGARYAESAAWLHEDSGGLRGARYWTGRSMEWALEAGDRLMSWVLYRRGEHAAADGDAAAVAGLAAAARREGGDLPDPMMAAILQQEAHAHALDGNEAACQTALDRAHEQAASPDDPGDASNGHGSFCTPAYVEMQRGRCWLRLAQPAKAKLALDSAIQSLPPVYRRDRGVALSALAAAFVGLGEPAEAAEAARQALGVARDAGSERIVSMVIPVGTALARYRGIEAVARLREALADPGA
jgi:tetratricopeptide (TPR) repeat protein